MARRALPAVYFDEHVKPGVVETFREEGFKCLLISKTRKYAGRDEKDYIQEIYAEEKLFMTCDIEFIGYVLRDNIKHAGILFIPPIWDNDIAAFYAIALAGMVSSHIREHGRTSMRKLIFYVAGDGYHIIDKEGDKLVYSMDAFDIDLDTPE